MAIKVEYLTEDKIENDAKLLLAEYEGTIGERIKLPVPVDDITTYHLALRLGFDDLHKTLNRYPGWECRQLAARRGVGVYAQQRGVDPAGRQAGRQRRGRDRSLSRCCGRPFRRRQYRHRWGTRRQLGGRRRLGVHTQQRRMDPARHQARRQRRDRASRARPLSRAFQRRQHRHHGRPQRQLQRRRGMDIHAQ